MLLKVKKLNYEKQAQYAPPTEDAVLNTREITQAVPIETRRPEPCTLVRFVDGSDVIVLGVPEQVLVGEPENSELRTRLEIAERRLEEGNSAWEREAKESTAQAEELRDRLAAALNFKSNFKSWVHGWLDDHGVPVDPDPKHTAETGCRISGRLQYLLAHLDKFAQRGAIVDKLEKERDRARDEVEKLKAALNHETWLNVEMTKQRDQQKKYADAAVEVDDLRRQDIRKLHQAIRKHRDSWLSGDDKCWKDNEELYRLLPEGYTAPARDTLCELKLCEKYIASCHAPHIEYVSPQRRIEELEKQLKAQRQAAVDALDARIDEKENPR